MVPVIKKTVETRWNEEYGDLEGNLEGDLEGDLERNLEGSLVHCLRRWEDILKYATFIVNTVSSALKHLQMMKNPKGIFLRWIEELGEFKFEVKHRPENLNLNTDNLSRCDHLPTKQEEELVEAIQEEELNLRNIGKGQQDDPTMTKVRGWEASPSKQWLVLSNVLDAAFGWSHQYSTVRYFRVAITVYEVQQRFPWTEMHREMQQKVAEYVEHIKNDQVVINRKIHQYQGGKYQETMERGPVWYSHTKRISVRIIELTLSWMRPVKLAKKITQVWVKITAAHTKSREFMVSVSRLNIYRTDLNLEHRRRPQDKEWEDDDGAATEDIQPPRDVPRGNIVIQNQAGGPAAV